MRTCSPELASALNSESTTLCRLWRVTRKDGTVMRFTDSVRPVTIQIAPDVTPQTYRADISFTASAIFLSRSFANQQSVTITFIMSEDGFNEDELRQRLYDGAASEVHVMDYLHPEWGTVNMYHGVWGTVTLSNLPIASVEVLPAQSSLNGIGIVNEKYSQTCRASLGDARCKVDIEALKVAFTIDTASGGSFVASELNQANGHWDLGFVKWLTGKNAGTTSQVQSNTAASTSVFLLSPPFFPILTGDTGEIFPGCDKLRQTCLTKFNNVVNGRFEPDVPDGAGVPGSVYMTTGGAIANGSRFNV